MIRGLTTSEIGLLCYTAIAVFASLTLVGWVFVTVRSRRRLRASRRAMALAMAHVDRARGLDLEETRQVIYVDRTGERTEVITRP